MADEEPPPKRGRGRPRSGKPPKKRVYNLERAKRESTRIYLMHAHENWVNQKSIFDSKVSHTGLEQTAHWQFAEHLLSAHKENNCRQCSGSEVIGINDDEEWQVLAGTGLDDDPSHEELRYDDFQVHFSGSSAPLATPSASSQAINQQNLDSTPSVNAETQTDWINDVEQRPVHQATDLSVEKGAPSYSLQPSAQVDVNSTAKQPTLAMATIPSELSEAELIKQGAEARVYTYTFYGKPCIIKERFKKTYRHPLLEERLTQKRISQEVKSLLRCKKAGIAVPAVYFVDTSNNTIYLENVEHSLTVREFIQQYTAPFSEEDNGVLLEIATKVGVVLAKLHDADIIHGDLTTSNMLLQSPHLNSVIYLIDFGLSQVSHLAEDKGVDLYVLEKAFLSTHPNTEQIFEQVLVSYKENYKKSTEVLRKLDEVRQRGRKRVMVG